MMMTCRTCGIEKDESEYYKGKKHCKPCWNAECLLRRKRIGRNWESNSPAATQRYNLKRNYGLTADQYAEMNRRQGGLCLICRNADGSGLNLAVDHDHSCCKGQRACARCIRGLLCGHCNKGIGYFRDNPTLLRSAAEYLDGFERSAA